MHMQRWFETCVLGMQSVLVRGVHVSALKCMRFLSYFFRSYLDLKCMFRHC
uniref:Uncharacterized protein n=1 Tax=Anguilla anguilla TaxID=7936 RepID=A0A0E9W3R0_ANGAN